MKVRVLLSVLIILGLGAAPLAAEAVVPAGAQLLENKGGEGKCAIYVNYTQGAVKSRQMNVNDVKWLMSQPGGIAMFADLHPRMDKAWLEQLIALNKPMNQFAIEAPDGSKACRTMAEMAKRLDERAKKKQWAEENTQELIVGGLLEANYPPFASNSGAAPAGTTAGTEARQ